MTDDDILPIDCVITNGGIAFSLPAAGLRDDDDDADGILASVVASTANEHRSNAALVCSDAGSVLVGATACVLDDKEDVDETDDDGMDWTVLVEETPLGVLVVILLL